MAMTYHITFVFREIKFVEAIERSCISSQIWRDEDRQLTLHL